MSRQKLLLLDQPYHAHTRSSDFLVELLSERFDVTIDYLTASPRDKAACLAQIRSHEPENIVLWQVALRAHTLVELGMPVTWVPMFDQSRRCWHQNYLEAALAGVSVLAFSKTVAGFAETWKLPCLNVCYYPRPGREPDVTLHCDRLLLWYRGFIQPSDVWPTLRDIRGLRVVIKNDIDPDAEGAERDDGDLADSIERVVEGFLPKDEYLSLTQENGLFIAPRKKEGIGLSFLEAMARGACVVAYDAPTMNEYIEHGKTGWLFSERTAPALPAEAIPDIRRAAYAQVVAGHEAWMQQRPAVLEFIQNAPPPSPQSGGNLVIAKPLANAISALTPLKHRLFGT